MCPRTYYSNSGTQCFPLILEIEHDWGREFTCIAFDFVHTLDGPTASSPTYENCKRIKSEEQIIGYTKKTKYWIGFSVPNKNACGGDTPTNAKVVFRINPPRRGFHGSSKKSDPPYILYDDSNPSCQLTIRARRGRFSTSEKITFEYATNSGNVEVDHLTHPKEQIFDLTVNITDSGIKISKQRASW